MKLDIFNQYVDRICTTCNVSKDGLFSKTKRRDCVDARYMLYYVCYKRPMSIKYIERYMAANGYDVKHPTIIHGIDVVEDRIKSDPDYLTIIKNVFHSVII